MRDLRHAIGREEGKKWGGERMKKEKKRGVLLSDIGPRWANTAPTPERWLVKCLLPLGAAHLPGHMRAAAHGLSHGITGRAQPVGEL